MRIVSPHIGPLRRRRPVLLALVFALGAVLLAAPSASAAPSGTVTGRLDHPAQNLLEGMRLYVYTAEADPQPVRFTIPVDEVGAFEISLPPGSYILCWSGEETYVPFAAQCLGGVGLADRAASTPFTVRRDKRTALGAIAIERQAQVSGRVLDPAGKPVEGALVCGRPVADIQPEDDDWYELCMNGFDYTDRNGRYSTFSRTETPTAFAFSTTDGLWARTYAGSTADLDDARILPSATDTRTTVNVRMQPRPGAFLWSGKVLDEKGDPLRRASVSALRLDPPRGTYENYEARYVDGSYAMGLTPGRYRFTVRADGYSGTSEDVIVSAERTKDITLVRPAVESLVVARITMGGAPLPGAYVELLDEDGKVSAVGSSGGDGRYVGRDVPPGTYSARVSVPLTDPQLFPITRTNGRTTFVVRAGGTTSDLVADLPVIPVRNDFRPALESVPTVGRAVSVSPGNWYPREVSTTYQWMRGDEPIAGATKRSYVPVADDAGTWLSVRVTGTRSPYAPTTVATLARVVQTPR